MASIQGWPAWLIKWEGTDHIPGLKEPYHSSGTSLVVADSIEEAIRRWELNQSHAEGVTLRIDEVVGVQCTEFYVEQYA